MARQPAREPSDTLEVQFDDHHRFHDLLGHHDEHIKTIERDTERDNFFGAEEATKYGLVDKVLVSRAEVAA